VSFYTKKSDLQFIQKLKILYIEEPGFI